MIADGLRASSAPSDPAARSPRCCRSASAGRAAPRSCPGRSFESVVLCVGGLLTAAVWSGLRRRRRRCRRLRPHARFRRRRRRRLGDLLLRPASAPAAEAWGSAPAGVGSGGWRRRGLPPSAPAGARPTAPAAARFGLGRRRRRGGAGFGGGGAGEGFGVSFSAGFGDGLSLTSAVFCAPSCRLGQLGDRHQFHRQRLDRARIEGLGVRQPEQAPEQDQRHGRGTMTANAGTHRDHPPWGAIVTNPILR